MPANTDAMMREAVRAMKSGKNDEAQTLLIKVTEYDESNVQAWLLLFDIIIIVGHTSAIAFNLICFSISVK